MRGLRILGLVAAVGLFVGACGGDDDSAAGDADFCDEAFAFTEGDAFNDPSTEAAREALDEADALEPPEEIADDWQMLIDGARVLSEFDPGEPEDLGPLPDEVEAMGPASTNVFRYLNEECGLDASG